MLYRYLLYELKAKKSPELYLRATKKLNERGVEAIKAIQPMVIYKKLLIIEVFRS